MIRNKILISFLIITGLCFSFHPAFSQKSDRTQSPKSFGYDSMDYPLTQVSNLDTKEMASVNRDSLLQEDKELEGLGFPFRFGYAHEVSYNLKNSGTWDELKNGDRIWRLKIECLEAFSINLMYDEFFIPEGSTFFLYDENEVKVLGAFTSGNNKVHKKFATTLIPGDVTFLEYYEPAANYGEGKIQISKIIHGYRDIIKMSDEDGDKHKLSQPQLLSGSCNRDANCPEGDELCREKYSISRILVGYDNDHLCTGSLINNVRQDYTPYYLTANHCMIGNPDTWVFEFRHLREGCGWGAYYDEYSYTGAELKASWAYSDFALLMLDEQPESGDGSFGDVFFNGWDATLAIPSSTKCLHHPNGDWMKISQDFDIPVITGYTLNTQCNQEQPNQFHWRVIWNTGTTEPGSSGAPLYNPNRRVIGQLHGGCASCNSPNLPDYYGRLSKSWLGGGTSGTQLKYWLDPDNTGILELDGIKMPHLRYGWNVNNGQTQTWKAYDAMKIGSSHIAPTTVMQGGNLTVKAGRSILIRPCTHIESGSEFHGYIEELDCSEVIDLSDKESNYNPNVCGTPPPKMAFPETFEYTSSDNCTLKIQPNPFNNQTNITISLSNDNNITLAVYDLLGNKINEFASNKMLSAGEHSFIFDASNLNAGMYYVNLIGDDFRLSKPIVLMK